MSDPESVATLGDLDRSSCSSTFLLYLRVSGQFHLIVGLLHLFGFRLPETHKLYYLAHSFTELWRRINIYWTDFMMKTVFYPIYFRVKQSRPGDGARHLDGHASSSSPGCCTPTSGSGCAADFPLTRAGRAVLDRARRVRRLRRTERAALRPASRAGSPASRASTRRAGCKTALTFTTFYTLWSLWSVDSVNLWLWMLGAAATVDGRGVVLFTGIFLTAFGLGGVDWKASGRQAGWLGTPSGIRTRTVAPLLALAVLAAPPVQTGMPEMVTAAVRSTQLTGLNARDLTLQHRGYYEQLDVRGPARYAGRGRRPQARRLVADTRPARPARRAAGPDAARSRAVDAHDLERPVLHTNRWGMRDQDYAKEKPPGTVRIALLGPVARDGQQRRR